jgi:hypothetical protein
MANHLSPQRLPVKVVLATGNDYPKRKPRPLNWDESRFPKVTQSMRDRLVGEIDAVSKYFARAFREWPEVPAIAKVQMRDNALAKTYRPTAIFDEKTCPIVGGSRFGELYVSVTPGRLQALKKRVGNDSSKEVKRQIAVLSHVAAFTKDNALATDTQMTDEPLRLRLFKHDSFITDDTIHRVIKDLCGKQDITANDAPYGPTLRILTLSGASERAIESLADFPGTQSISPFPKYRAAKLTSIPITAMPRETIAEPDSNREYPVVLLIDSGTDPNNQPLQKWIVKRWNAVKRVKQNNDHGSFVAGLLCSSRSLNDNDPAFPSCAAKIIDVAAIDETEIISEIELVTILYAALKKFPEARIVNLSLSIEGSVCEDDAFSSLAVALDGFSRQFGVRFAVPTGNYTRISATWPRQKEIGSEDRILSPADQILGISSGAVAHRDSHKTTVKVGDPSPFTRGGPGPAYVPSPLLVHNGGNMDEDGGYFRTGIVSVDGKGNICEDAGVSFSNPLIATLYANLEHELSAGNPDSFCLSKGFLIHSAILEQLPSDDKFNYCGFGRPQDIDKIVTCEQSSATVVFHTQLSEGKKLFTKRNFPMPRCLVVDGKLQCELLMTLVYEPPLDASYGCEYCRVNVDAALGIVHANGKFDGQLDPVPRRKKDGYEPELIKHGFKWSPVKAYYGTPSNVDPLLGWELRVQVRKRANQPTLLNQDVCILVTVRDPSGVAPVYDEMVRAMNNLAWSPLDIQIRSRMRGRYR